MTGAERVGADLIEFAAPDNAEFVGARKSFKTAANQLGRQTQKKHLRRGNTKTNASRVITANSAIQTSQLGDSFSNISH